jgi:hypothetical protein
MALAELFLALELLDGVKQRDGISPSSTPEQTAQEKFVEGTKDFIEGIKDKFKWPPSKRK